ncbi:HAD family hydrolase [Lapillicoccus sp.]|uniref:HAD family hydrolase n=1 Tax=Lapillicoccus sp. TaxID=1909287 RepID=UPI0025EE0B17|nr:HAD family hydrolase [Lapillicoccus sp.]
MLSGFAQLPLHADVANGIRALHGLGPPLVTLSNGAATVARGLPERRRPRNPFERLLSAQHAPARKPAASAFRYAIQACRVPGAQAMLVADRPWDIRGAHQAGLRTAWINRTGGPCRATMRPTSRRCR